MSEHEHQWTAVHAIGSGLVKEHQCKCGATDSAHMTLDEVRVAATEPRAERVSLLAAVMHREFWVDEKPHVDDAEKAQMTDCSICWGVAFRIDAALPDPEHRRSER